MIYTVTFNPSLDYIVSVDGFQLGRTNRTSSELMLPGGKGSMYLQCLATSASRIRRLGLLPGLPGQKLPAG